MGLCIPISGSGPLSVCPSVCLSYHPVHSNICSTIHLSSHLFIHLSNHTCPSIQLSHQFINLWKWKWVKPCCFVISKQPTVATTIACVSSTAHSPHSIYICVLLLIESIYLPMVTSPGFSGKCQKIGGSRWKYFWIWRWRYCKWTLCAWCCVAQKLSTTIWKR